MHTQEPEETDLAVIPDEAAWQVCQRIHRDEYDEITRRVATLMSWPMSKATVFMTTRNPLLGNVSPCQMIALGRTARLKTFIEHAESMNSELTSSTECEKNIT